MDSSGSAHAVTITRLDDPRLDAYRDVRDKDLRGRDHRFMAESDRVLRRLLRTPERLESVLLSPARHESLADELAGLPASVAIYVAEGALMTEVAGFHVHRGVLAVGHRPKRHELTPAHALGHLRGRPRCTLLAAEGITNVDNIGGLFRNAAAFGVDGVILDPTSCDPLYRKAIRVSAGHVLSTPWAIVDPWPEGLFALCAEWGMRLVAAEAAATSVPPWTVSRSDRDVLLFGSEAYGVRPDVLARANAVVEIPMAEGVPSLNVATASAVLLYEWQRPAPVSDA